MSNVTIKDVAKRANVSIATVSLILNGKAQSIPDSTIERVHAACKELNYKRNLNASSLKSKISKLVGLIVPDLENAYYSRVASSISTNLSERGYSLVISSCDNNFQKELDYIEQMANRQVDALFLFPSATGLLKENRNDLKKALDESDLKIIILDRKTSFNSYIEVVNDDLYGATLASEYLINKGYKRIACITGPKDVSSSDERLEGYKKTLKKHHIYDESLIYTGDYHFPLAKQQAMKILKRDDVDAIFAFNDISAYAVYDAADELGKRVGSDIAVVGYDNNQFSDLITPKLTSVGQNISEMSSIAVNKMFEDKYEPEIIAVQPSLFIREE